MRRDHQDQPLAAPASLQRDFLKRIDEARQEFAEARGSFRTGGFAEALSSLSAARSDS
jgi:hypothetical protein